MYNQRYLTGCAISVLLLSVLLSRALATSSLSSFVYNSTSDDLRSVTRLFLQLAQQPPPDIFPSFPPGGLPDGLIPLSPECLKDMQSAFQDFVGKNPLAMIGCVMTVQSMKETNTVPSMQELCSTCGDTIVGVLDSVKDSKSCFQGDYLKHVISRLTCERAYSLYDAITKKHISRESAILCAEELNSRYKNGIHPVVEERAKTCALNLQTYSLSDYCQQCDVVMRTETYLNGNIEECKTQNEVSELLRGLWECPNETLKIHIAIVVALTPQFSALDSGQISDYQTHMRVKMESMLDSYSSVKILRVDLLPISSSPGGRRLSKQPDAKAVVTISTLNNDVPNVVHTIITAVSSNPSIFGSTISVSTDPGSVSFTAPPSVDSEGSFSENGPRFAMIIIGCLAVGGLCTVVGVILWRRCSANKSSQPLQEIEMKIAASLGVPSSAVSYSTVSSYEIPNEEVGSSQDRRVDYASATV